MEKEFDRKREAGRRGRKRGGKTRTGRKTFRERERKDRLEKSVKERKGSRVGSLSKSWT